MCTLEPDSNSPTSCTQLLKNKTTPPKLTLIRHLSISNHIDSLGNQEHTPKAVRTIALHGKKTYPRAQSTFQIDDFPFPVWWDMFGFLKGGFHPGNQCASLRSRTSPLSVLRTFTVGFRENCFGWNKEHDQKGETHICFYQWIVSKIYFHVINIKYTNHRFYRQFYGSNFTIIIDIHVFPAGQFVAGDLDGMDTSRETSAKGIPSTKTGLMALTHLKNMMVKFEIFPR